MWFAPLRKYWRQILLILIVIWGIVCTRGYMEWLAINKILGRATSESQARYFGISLARLESRIPEIQKSMEQIVQRLQKKEVFEILPMAPQYLEHMQVYQNEELIFGNVEDEKLYLKRFDDSGFYVKVASGNKAIIVSLVREQYRIMGLAKMDWLLSPFSKTANVFVLSPEELLNIQEGSEDFYPLFHSVLSPLKNVIDSSGFGSGLGLKGGGQGIWQTGPFEGSSRAEQIALGFFPQHDLWFVAWEIPKPSLMQRESVRLKIFWIITIVGTILSLLVSSLFLLFKRYNQDLKRLEDINAVSRDFMWETDEGFHFTYMSNRVYSILGYTANELQSWSFMNLMENDAEVKHRLFLLFDKRLPVVGFECRMVHKYGHLVWISITGIPLMDGTSWIGFRGSCADVTPQKSQENKLQALFDGSPDGIVLHDEQGKILDCNPTFLQLLNTGRNILHGNYLSNWNPPECTEELRNAWSESLSQKKTITFESEILPLEREATPVGVKVAPVEIEGRVILCAVYRDITQIKQAKQKLIEAKEASEQANRMKSDFLANISHEIRTPMNSILGFADLMQKEMQEPKLLAYCKSIGDVGRQLLSLLNDLLDLSKIEAGKLILQLMPLSVLRIAQEVIEIFSLRAKDKGIELELEHNEVPRYLMLDELRIRQILLNLVGNAVKFTSQGKIMIRLQYDIHPQFETPRLMMRVTDTGCGIPREDFQRIFEMFEQQNPHMNRTDGTGLGLAITKKLIQMMNGQIHVQSEVGIGSTFTVELCPVVTPDSMEDTIAAAQTLSCDLKGKDVLIVEDNLMNMALMAEYLRNTQARIYKASDGIQALKLLDDVTPDLILLDLAMPNLDGEQFLREMQSQSHIFCPVIVISASSEKQVRQAFSEMPVQAFLTKPIQRQKLFQVIEEVLKAFEITASSERLHSQSEIETILKALEGEMFAELQSVRFSKKVQKIRRFADRLNQFALRWKLPIVKRYARRLKLEADSFNIAGMTELMNEYERMVEECHRLRLEPNQD